MPSLSIVLRSYQVGVKFHILDTWQTHKALMVQIPIGTGKTHLFASVINDHLKEEQGQCVWIVAHRRKFVKQIKKTVANYGISQKDDRRMMDVYPVAVKTLG